MTADELLKIRLILAQRFAIEHQRRGDQYIGDVCGPAFNVWTESLREADDLLCAAGVDVTMTPG
jgi:hypothetical protein